MATPTDSHVKIIKRKKTKRVYNLVQKMFVFFISLKTAGAQSKLLSVFEAESQLIFSTVSTESLFFGAFFSLPKLDKIWLAL